MPPPSSATFCRLKGGNCLPPRALPRTGISGRGLWIVACTKAAQPGWTCLSGCKVFRVSVVFGFRNFSGFGVLQVLGF